MPEQVTPIDGMYVCPQCGRRLPSAKAVVYCEENDIREDKARGYD